MITSLAWMGRMVMIYGGIPVFIAGVLGGLLNTVLFLSLWTFRESSCALYLTVMSIVNNGQLISGLLSRILVALIGIDGTETSVFYCKFRPFTFPACIFSSLTCFCLATIDQCCATCSRFCFQQWCHIKLVQRVTMINILTWILYGIPYLFYFDHVPSPNISSKIIRASTNPGLAQYRTYMILFALSGFRPVVIPTVFAYQNVQQIAYRTVPLVRRELDKQLTKMVLVQVIVNVLSVNASLISNSITQASLQLASTITLVIYYLYFSAKSILHLRLYFGPISSTVDPCPGRDTHQSMETSKDEFQSSDAGHMRLFFVGMPVIAFISPAGERRPSVREDFEFIDISISAASGRRVSRF